jgi:two-component system LytT family response regulator
VKPTALIAEDEALARRKLRDLIAEVPLVDVVGEVEDGEACVRAIEELRPDVLFLDVQMPGLSGLDVLSRTGHKPLTIFTTAYDQYAVAAFELAAVDYLLKPFGKDRLRVALERAVQAFDSGERSASPDRLRAAWSDRPVNRLFVRDRGKIIPLAAAHIERLEAKDDYAALHASGRTYLVHVPLNVLEQRLDPERFVRVHRSHIVNLDFVAALEPYDATRLQVVLRDGTKILASRTRSRALKAWAE